MVQLAYLHCTVTVVQLASLHGQLPYLHGSVTVVHLCCNCGSVTLLARQCNCAPITLTAQQCDCVTLPVWQGRYSSFSPPARQGDFVHDVLLEERLDIPFLVKADPRADWRTNKAKSVACTGVGR